MTELSSIWLKNIENMHKTKKEFSLKNSSMEILLSNIGASILKILLSSSDSSFKNIALTLASSSESISNSLYAGATLAPAAGRVKNGLLRMGEDIVQLEKNENNETNLHGGSHNLSFACWDVLSQTESSVTFESFLPDGLDGYPGNRNFYVTYTLEDSSLLIHQKAVSDRKTYFNMSNHTYFNLNAFSCSGLEQYLQIHADTVILNNEIHIPLKMQDTADTPFAFKAPVLLADRLNVFSSDKDILSARGFNHYFVFPENRRKETPDCVLFSKDKRISMSLFTDAPAIVFYSGGFIDGEYSFSFEQQLQKTYPGCAIALEPTELPLNLRNFSGQTSFERTIRLEFCMR